LRDQLVNLKEEVEVDLNPKAKNKQKILEKNLLVDLEAEQI